MTGWSKTRYCVMAPVVHTSAVRLYGHLKYIAFSKWDQLLDYRGDTYHRCFILSHAPHSRNVLIPLPEPRVRCMRGRVTSTTRQQNIETTCYVVLCNVHATLQLLISYIYEIWLTQKNRCWERRKRICNERNTTNCTLLVNLCSAFKSSNKYVDSENNAQMHMQAFSAKK